MRVESKRIRNPARRLKRMPACALGAAGLRLSALFCRPPFLSASYQGSMPAGPNIEIIRVHEQAAKPATLFQCGPLTLINLPTERVMSKRAALLERFMRYAAVPTQSNPKAGVVPSAPGERILADMLAQELAELGLTDVAVSEHAVVTARLAARGADNAPKIGWIIHMDTVDVGLSPEIRPKLVRNYPGGDILQNEAENIWLRAAEHPELERYKGDDILISDGTSVLGADDKSAIANVMTALSIMQAEKRPHGEIFIAFVPDEELGEQGARKLDLARFPVDYAYTIDCCELGEIVWETFNAGNATLTVTGVPAHPMSSKGVLVNPILVVHDFISMLDRAETPEHTEGREGFIVLKTLQANPSRAVLTMKIRDHDRSLYEAKKAKLAAAAAYLRVRHPKAGIELALSDSYANIADAIRPDNRDGIDLLYRVFRALEIQPKTKAMRGGTDGAYLSTKGILTPNYFTGAHNFHSSAEFLPMSSWEKSLDVTLALMTYPQP